MSAVGGLQGLPAARLPWQVARTQFNYAQMLLAHGEPGDREKARGLLQQALAAARQMGLVKVASDCEALLAGA